jgi:hypothetical protein
MVIMRSGRASALIPLRIMTARRHYGTCCTAATATAHQGLSEGIFPEWTVVHDRFEQLPALCNHRRVVVPVMRQIARSKFRQLESLLDQAMGPMRFDGTIQPRLALPLLRLVILGSKNRSLSV